MSWGDGGGGDSIVKPGNYGEPNLYVRSKLGVQIIILKTACYRIELTYK